MDFGSSFLYNEEMKTKQTIILFKGIYDTLDLFSNQLAAAFMGWDYDLFVYDATNVQTSKTALLEMLTEKKGNAAVVTFNNMGYNLEQDDVNVVTMHDIYTNAAGYRTSEGEYDFEGRKEPDVIVVHLGANDTTSTTAGKTIADWKTKMDAFVSMLREKNPDSAIVLVNHRADKMRMLLQIVDERSASDPNLHCFSFTHQARGSAAKTTQYYGHPSAADSKELGEALADFLVERGLIPQEEQTVTYSDINYYAAQTGSDSNAGTAEGAAKLTLKGAMAQAKADYPTGFPNGSRLVFNLTGTVKFNPTSSSMLGNVGELKTVDGKDVPILVTTHNYNGTKAILDTGHKTTDTSSCLVYFCHSMTLKDITFQSTTNEADASKMLRDYLLYAGFNQIVFDNVTFAQAGATPTHNNYGWIVSAGNATANDIPVPTEKTTSSITFKNGDYTNLLRATCVQSNNLWRNTANGGTITSAPDLHCELIIDDGAKMSTVYNRYGKMNYGSCTVYMKGGSVNQYHGTQGFAESAKYTYQGDVNFVMTGGNIYGQYFYGLSSYASITGNLNTTISGGVIKLRPTADWQCLSFGANTNSTINGNVNNTISGGNFFIIGKDNAAFSAGIYFAGRNNVYIKGDVVNKITGGSFLPLDGKDGTASISFTMAMTSGSIGGELRNEIIGGTFDGAGATTCDFRFGSPNPNNVIPKVVNIIGNKNDLGSGPMFMNTLKESKILLGSTRASYGATSTPTAMPAVSECSDTVVLSNTIYGGYFYNDIFCGPITKHSGTYYEFVKGSIENNIYGGYFRGTLFGAGNANVYGKVTTNVHGGYIGNIYAGGDNATVYDGVELNIYDVYEMHDVYLTNSWHYWGGARNVDIPIPQTTDRPAIKVNVAPTRDSLVLKTPVTAISRYSENLNVTKDVCVSGGIYPEGFGVEGVTVNAALAEGYVVKDTATGAVLTIANDATVTGTSSVTIGKDPSVRAVNLETGAKYATLDMALADAETSGGTIRLEQDITQDSISVWDGVTLDLNGCDVNTRYFACFGDLTDGSAGGEANLKVAKKLHIMGESSYLPLYDSQDECYRLYKHNMNNLAGVASGTEGNAVKFYFRLDLANPDGYRVLANTKPEDLDMRIYIGWGGMPALIDYSFTDATLMAYADQVAKDYAEAGETDLALTFTVKGLKKLSAGDTVTMKPVLKTTSGVHANADEVLSWTVQPAN